MLFSGAATAERIGFRETIRNAATTAARSRRAAAISAQRIRLRVLLERAELFWQMRIANSIAVEIDHLKTHAVFHLAVAEVVQVRPPMTVLLQVFRHMSREKNVTGIAAIHDPLRHVDARPGDVGPPAHIGHFAYRPAVDAHPHCDLRMSPERLCDLERTTRRLFGAVAKDQRHPVAGGKPHQLFIGRRRALGRSPARSR